MATDRAKALAVEREMDLVEVAPQAQPPVARIMDYGKFKFESLKKDKDGRRKHNVIKVKEMKLRPKIGEHDFQTKFHAVKSFLEEGDKVKLTIMFRGREMVHQDIGKKLLDRMALELKTISTIERMPLLEGRNMIMILAPAAAAQAPQCQAQRSIPPSPQEDPESGQGLPDDAPDAIPSRQRSPAARARVRVSRPAGAQARHAQALDRPDQCRIPQPGATVQPVHAWS